MNVVFYIIGICILITAFLNGTSVESAMHQIYVQLQYLTGISLIGFGHLYTCINNLKNKNNENPKKVLPNEQERKEFEQKQMESINNAIQYKQY